MNNSVVIFENVTFAYDDSKPVINNISLQLETGKIVAVMGGSGSGKTTLLRLMTGQLSPQSGKVILFGHDINKISNKELLQLRKRLGVLFQFGALFTDMSVYDNVAFSLHEHTSLPKTIIDKIVAMKLHAVGLFGTQDLYPQDLSGGMARRVALARAMALDPELMLYDEPFTGLDPITLNVTGLLLQQLNQLLHQSVVLVTHDIHVSLRISDYVYFLADGKLIAQDTPHNLQNSTNPIIQQFITGDLHGASNFEYPTHLNYNDYLGIKA